LTTTSLPAVGYRAWCRRGNLVAVAILVAFGWSTLSAESATAYGPITTVGPAGSTTTIPAPSGNSDSEPTTVSASTVTPGTSLTASIAGVNAGPCAPDGPVSLNLQLLQFGTPPVTLATATANASGGVDPLSVTVPSNSALGTYVIYGQCINSGGKTVELTSGFVVVTSTATSPHTVQVAVPANFRPAASASAPALAAAIRSQVIRSDTPAPSSASGTQSAPPPTGSVALSFPAKYTQPARPSSSLPTVAATSAVALILVGSGLLVMRRRRPRQA